MTAATQTQQLREWIEGMRRASSRARALASSLTAEQLNWSPPHGKWSAAQILEHLAITNDQYLDAIRQCFIGGSGCEPAPAPGRWKPSPAGAFLGFMLQRPNLRVKAPPAFHPSRAGRSDALQAFLETQRELESEADRVRVLDLRRTRIRSPVSDRIRLNLGDAFSMMEAHVDRHLGQLEKLTRRPDFPRA